MLLTTLAQVVAAGGRELMQPFLTGNAGEIAYIEDPEGNVCGVARYLAE